MTLANISMGSEVRFASLWKGGFYHPGISLTSPEPVKPVKPQNQIHQSILASLSQKQTTSSEDGGICLALMQWGVPVKACIQRWTEKRWRSRSEGLQKSIFRNQVFLVTGKVERGSSVTLKKQHHHFPFMWCVDVSRRFKGQHVRKHNTI